MISYFDVIWYRIYRHPSSGAAVRSGKLLLAQVYLLHYYLRYSFLLFTVVTIVYYWPPRYRLVQGECLSLILIILIIQGLSLLPFINIVTYYWHALPSERSLITDLPNKNNIFVITALCIQPSTHPYPPFPASKALGTWLWLLTL